MPIFLYSSVIDPEQCFESDPSQLKDIELNKVYVGTHQFGICSLAVEANNRKQAKNIARALVAERLEKAIGTN